MYEQSKADHARVERMTAHERARLMSIKHTGEWQLKFARKHDLQPRIALWEGKLADIQQRLDADQ